MQGSVENLNQLPRRHDDAARSLQEAPLAGGRTDVLPAAPAVRQALRTSRTSWSDVDRRAHPDARRRQPRPWRPTSPRPRLIPRPPKGARRRRCRSRGCCTPTRSSSKEARAMARQAPRSGGDDGTNDLLVSDVDPRATRLQVWFRRGARRRRPARARRLNRVLHSPGPVAVNCLWSRQPVSLTLLTCAPLRKFDGVTALEGTTSQRPFLEKGATP